MKHATTKLIEQHLEYLGYSIEDHSDPSAPSDLLLAFHPRRANLVLHNNNQEIIFIKARFGDYLTMHRSEMIEKINEINVASVLTKWRVLEDDNDENKLNLSIAACQTGYEKTDFSTFIDHFEYEINEFAPQFEQFAQATELLPALQSKN